MTKNEKSFWWGAVVGGVTACVLFSGSQRARRQSSRLKNDRVPPRRDLLIAHRFTTVRIKEYAVEAWFPPSQEEQMQQRFERLLERGFGSPACTRKVSSPA